MKDTKCQTVEEISRGQIARHGTQGEARSFSKETRDVFQLWNVVFATDQRVTSSKQEFSYLPETTFFSQ